jgi:hypothetical protein
MPAFRTTIAVFAKNTIRLAYEAARHGADRVARAPRRVSSATARRLGSKARSEYVHSWGARIPDCRLRYPFSTCRQ